MPLLGFKFNLAPKVLNGSKPFTLRDWRKDKRDPVAGQKLFMYTGLRTKKANNFVNNICTRTTEITLKSKGGKISLLPKLLGREINQEHELENFARLDGFDTLRQFIAFHGLNKPGKKSMLMICWQDWTSIVARIERNKPTP